MSAPSLKLCQQLKLFHSLEATLAQQVELNSQLGSKNLKEEYSWIGKAHCLSFPRENRPLLCWRPF